MKKVLLIAAGIFFMVMGECGQSLGQTLKSSQISMAERQVDSVFHASVKAAESLDYNKISKDVEDKYHAGFITNGTYYAKYDSLIGVLNGRPLTASRQTIQIQREKITVLSDRIALLTASGESKVDLNSGNTISVKFFWSFVYEKISGNWKVIHSHQSAGK